MVSCTNKDLHAYKDQTDTNAHNGCLNVTCETEFRASLLRQLSDIKSTFNFFKMPLKKTKQGATSSLLHQTVSRSEACGRSPMKRPSTLEELANCRTPLPPLLLRYGTDSASTRCPPSPKEDTVERPLEAYYSLSKAH